MPGAAGGKAAVSLGDALRLYDRPITRVENYCATGTDAFRNACLAIASGVYDVVLVLGAEKLKDRGGRASAPAARARNPRGSLRSAPRAMHAFGAVRRSPRSP
jgi:acetyl-CoA acetyltransferase